MQMNQYVGLNQWAQAKVLAKRTAVETGERTFADGSKEPFERTVDVPVARITAVGKIEGYFDEVVADLRRFELPNGEVYEEFIEATLQWWSDVLYRAERWRRCGRSRITLGRIHWLRYRASLRAT